MRTASPTPITSMHQHQRLGNQLLDGCFPYEGEGPYDRSSSEVVRGGQYLVRGEALRCQTLYQSVLQNASLFLLQDMVRSMLVGKLVLMRASFSRSARDKRCCQDISALGTYSVFLGFERHLIIAFRVGGSMLSRCGSLVGHMQVM